MLDVDAVRAVTRLIDKGFEAYLVGGCVRDLLLDRTPKDYDIATEARPPQVKRTFPRNCRIIGRRFKLAHLHFHGNTKILECSTFRRTPQEHPDGEGEDTDLLITRDNEFGTAEEDALRRDFTVNALFLDPTRDLIVDHVNGLEDIDARVIRTIGDPVVRFREDPVRILRAAKFVGRLGFTVEKNTLAAMGETAEDLVRAAPPRVLEEILRLLRSGHARKSFELLRDVGAIEHLVPVVGKFLKYATNEQSRIFWTLIDALDLRLQSRHADSEPPPNGVLLAVLMYCAVEAERGQQPTRSASSVAESLLGSLAIDLRLPRRDSGCLKRICGVQHRFEQPENKRRFRTESFVHSPYFEEALQLFALRTAAAGKGRELVDHWYDTAGTHPITDEDASAEAGVVPEAEDREDMPRKKRRRRRRRSEEDEEGTKATAESDEAANSDADAEEPEVVPTEENQLEDAAPVVKAKVVKAKVVTAKAKKAKKTKAKAKAKKKVPAKEEPADVAPAAKKPGRRPKKPAAAEEDLSDVTFPSSDEPAPHGDPFHDRAAQASHAVADKDAAFPADRGNDDRSNEHRSDTDGRSGERGDHGETDSERAGPARRQRSRRGRDDEHAGRPRDNRETDSRGEHREDAGDRGSRDPDGGEAEATRTGLARRRRSRRGRDDQDSERPRDERDDREGDSPAEPREAAAQGNRDHDGDREARGGKRRRRGRRGRGRSPNDDDERGGGATTEVARSDDDGDRPEARQSRSRSTHEPRGAKVKAKKPANERQRDAKKRGQRGDGRRDKKRSHKGNAGGNRDVDVVPRYRDRRGKVEVIEPVSLDLSAFDVELDPKRVPTFGSIVEGKGRPKRRGPRPPEQDQDSYRPPPPPGGQDRSDSPPPDPPADSPDTFGDW